MALTKGIKRLPRSIPDVLQGVPGPLRKGLRDTIAVVLVGFAQNGPEVDAYAEVGITCLVIWEAELRDPEAVRRQVAAFCQRV